MLNRLVFRSLGVRAVTVLLFVASLCACAKKSPDPEESPNPPEVEKTLRERYSAAPGNWPKPSLDDGLAHRELTDLLARPTDAELDVEKIKLGKLLFADRYVASNGRSCMSSCHVPGTYWVSHSKVTVLGLERNTPTMENAWYLNGNLFLDGRAKTYAEQIETAITSPVEMNQPMATLPAKLAATGFYQPHFKKAFGDDAINRERILDAIAAFSQTIVSGETKFDRFVKGDYAALDDQELNGLHLFRTKARCINCHNGPYFTDLKFHNLGYAGMQIRTSWWDMGRYDATGLEEDKGKFRTPGLRNVANTRPYFHNGELATLKEVVDAKNAGMPRKGDLRFLPLDPLIKPLGLTDEEKEDIIAFLHALSSPPIVPDDLKDFTSEYGGI